MFQLQNISKQFTGTNAVDSIDLSITHGQTSVLIGPSGCGKSTLLKLMIGLIWQDTGQILFDGEAVRQSKLLNLRKQIGYVIQEGGLFPHLTIRKNITLMADYLKWDSEKIKSRLLELLDLAQLSASRLDDFPLQISGGQRQRVSLMRALMLEPDVLLLDEPLGALDPMVRAKLQNDLKQIFQSLGKTVVMVTHDMGEAAFFGDTIILMREGRVIQKGTMMDFIESPDESFVTDFINAQRSPLDTIGGVSN